MVIKIYKLDKDTLNLVEIPKHKILIAVTSVLIITVLLTVMTTLYIKKEREKLNYQQLLELINLTENKRVSPSAIFEYMKEIGIKYPEIVWSQVALETRFCSRVSQENHNYFGMKNAARRPNLQSGKNLNHAAYKNWKLSVIDYAMWQASVGVLKIKSEREYLEYLGKRYAADPNYVEKIKSIREKFDYYLEKYDTQFKNGDLADSNICKKVNN